MQGALYLRPPCAQHTARGVPSRDEDGALWRASALSPASDVNVLTYVRTAARSNSAGRLRLKDCSPRLDCGLCVLGELRTHAPMAYIYIFFFSSMLPRSPCKCGCSFGCL